MQPARHNVYSATGPAGRLGYLYADCLRKTEFFDVQSTECTLDNPIYPIFAYTQWRKGNFDSIGKELYAKMKPALQLASLWITDDRMLDWFYEDTASETKFVHRNGRMVAYRELWPGLNLQNPQAREHVRGLWLQKLHDLSKVGLLTFQFHKMDNWALTFYHKVMAETWKNDPGFHVCNFHAFGNMFAKEWNGIFVPNQKTPSMPQVILSDLFTNFLDSIPSDTEALSVPKKRELLSFHFLLATTLVHELAHAVNYFPQFRLWHPIEGGYEEAYHSLEEVDCVWRRCMNGDQPESGWSWQTHTFGDAIIPNFGLYPKHNLVPPADDPANFKLGSSGLVLMTKKIWKQYEMFVNRGVAVPEYGGSGALLYPPESVAQWFRKEHWYLGRTKKDLLKDTEKTYFVESRPHQGEWKVEGSWDLNTAATVTVKVYETADLNRLN